MESEDRENSDATQVLVRQIIKLEWRTKMSERLTLGLIKIAAKADQEGVRNLLEEVTSEMSRTIDARTDPIEIEGQQASLDVLNRAKRSAEAR